VTVNIATLRTDERNYLFYLFVSELGKNKNKYLSSKLQEEDLQIAVSGDRTNCQLALLRKA
jgi:hypothetical protein